ncbi:YfhO family protein [Archangium violaceum]|uniref:YfhO family protein n=1 Tax=Archangium violaceum TaxID=83451 RepID=UPI002B2E7D58|nr:YfhO family protein [Archangium violaceum]
MTTQPQPQEQPLVPAPGQEASRQAPPPSHRPAVRLLVALVPGLLIVTAVLAFHVRAAAPGMAFSSDDLREYFIPVRYLLQHTVRGGDWPFWQRSIYAGFPLWSSSEAGIFLPTTWLYFAVEAARALTLSTLTHLVVAALGMFVWQRHRGRSVGAAMAAAFIVALGGFTTVHLDHWTFSATLAPLPWTMLAVDEAMRRGLTPGLFLGAALGIAGLWFGGAAQIAYFGTLLVGGYVALQVLSTRGKAWPLLLVLPAGLLLAAPLILAGAEFSAYSPRAGGMTLRWASFYHWPTPRALALLLFPDAWGRPPAYSGEFNYWEMTGYLGLPALVLVLTTRPKRLGWYFLAVLVLSLVLCFGSNTPLYGLFFRYLPGFNMLRVATRALFLANFAAAVLTADALDTLAERRRWWQGLPVVAGTLVLLGVAWWMATRAEALGFRASAVRASLPWTMGVLAVFAVWVAARDLPKRWPALFPLGAALLVFADLHHAYSNYMPVLPTKALARHYPPLPPAQEGARSRVLQVGFNPNVTASSGAEGVTGYSQLLVDRIYDLLYATRSGGFSIIAGAPVDDEYGKIWPTPGSPLFPLFAAPSIVAPGPVRGLTIPAQRDGQFWRYPIKALPLAFWTQQYEVMDGARFRQEVHRFQPFETVTVEPTQHPLPPSAPTDAPRPATITSRGPNHTELEVSAQTPGLLVVMDPWFPGWSAEVDGKAAPLLRADYAFMAVPVPEGAHRVVLRYVPATLWKGLACVLAVLAGLGGWAWLRRGSGPLALRTH